MATIADFVGTTDNRLWRVINHYVTEAMKKVDLRNLEAFGLDETSYKRGHKYVTVFIDLDRDTRPVVFATIGKGKKTVERFKAHLKKKGGAPDRVLEVVSDMSGSFVGAVGEHFPNAEITVDWFHVVQLFTKLWMMFARLKPETVNCLKGRDGAFSKGEKPPKHKLRLRRFRSWRVRHMQLESHIESRSSCGEYGKRKPAMRRNGGRRTSSITPAKRCWTSRFSVLSGLHWALSRST